MDTLITPEKLSYLSEYTHSKTSIKSTLGELALMHYDDKGKQIESKTNFSEGLVIVNKDGKFGYMDKYQKLVIPPQFDDAERFMRGKAKVRNGSRTFYIDKTGREITTFTAPKNNFSDGLAVFQNEESGKCGFIDKTGIIRVPIIYDEAYKFSEGLAAVKLKQKYGYVDKTGKEVIPIMYEMVGGFYEGFAAVQLLGKWGYIEKTGKPIALPQYNMAYPFREGLAAVKMNNKYGFIDQTGKEVIPIVYTQTKGGFSQGLAAVRQEGGLWGFINKEGKVVIPFKYDSADNFLPVGKAEVVLKGKHIVIDITGGKVK
jgi:hypothetical protein